MSHTAREIMQSQVITISPEESLIGVQRLFFEEEINGAPVVDDDGRILGMISTIDLVRAATDADDTRRPEPSLPSEILDLSGPGWSEDVSDAFARRLGAGTAADIMSDSVVTVDLDAPIDAIARVLRENRIHRFLVIEDAQLRGIISTFDMVALLEKTEED